MHAINPYCSNRNNSRLLFSSAEMFKNLFGKQCGPRLDCSCSGSTLFASILNSSVMLGNYSQQTTSADDNFKCILRVNRRVDKFTPRVQSDQDIQFN